MLKSAGKNTVYIIMGVDPYCVPCTFEMTLDEVIPWDYISALWYGLVVDA